MYVRRFRHSGLVVGSDVAAVGVAAGLAVQAERGDLHLEGGPVGTLELQMPPAKLELFLSS